MDENKSEAEELIQEVLPTTKKSNIILDSQLFSTFEGCARLSNFRFNLHFVSIKGKSPSLEMGSIVHTFLEVYHKAIIAGEFKSSAITLAMKAAGEYSRSNEVRNTPQDKRQLALDTCSQYMDFYKNDHWVSLEVEKVKGKLIYEDDEIRIIWKAKFDLIADTNQGILPIDHKTMSQRRDTTNLNNQFTGQCVVQGTRLVVVNKIGFQTSLKPEEKFLRVPLNYSRDRLIEWQTEIVPFYAKLMLAYNETGHYPPNFNHCENKYGFCQFKKVCESDRNMREEEIRNEFVVGEIWDILNDEND